MPETIAVKICQSLLAPEPLWAWGCSASDRQDAIHELMNCVLCGFGKETGDPMWTTFFRLGVVSIASADRFTDPAHRQA